MSSRFFRSALVTVLGAALAGPVTAQQTPEPAAQEAAQAAAEAWLAHMDAGEYADSWDAAGAMFQQAVSSEAWTTQATAMAGQLGKVKNRSFTAAQAATNPPNSPPGDYITLVYTADYPVGSGLNEIVSLVREDDGWKVVGFFVRPPGG